MVEQLSEQDMLHIQQVNKVLDYLHTNMDTDLSLSVLAKIAGFSEYHFHRIFRDMMDETLNRYVWNTRINFAARLLRSKPKLSISEVAQRTGFKSLPGFTRAFKRQYDIAPSDWNRQERMINPEMTEANRYEFCQLLHIAQMHQFVVRIKQIPAMRVAYVRVPGYGNTSCIEEAYNRITHFAHHNQILRITNEDNCFATKDRRYFDWGIPIVATYNSENLIQIREFPAFAVASVYIGQHHHLEFATIQFLQSVWLPNSPYYLQALPQFTIYHDGGSSKQMELEIALPISRY